MTGRSRHEFFSELSHGRPQTLGVLRKPNEGSYPLISEVFVWRLDPSFKYIVVLEAEAVNLACGNRCGKDHSPGTRDRRTKSRERTPATRFGKSVAIRKAARRTFLPPAPKAHPQKPGRKAGAKYGRRCRRKIPEKVDETVEVPLPQQCPQCGGRLKETELVSQYQTEIPEPRVERIEFRIHVGHCRQCGERVQGRHPRQTSQAVGQRGLTAGTAGAGSGHIPGYCGCATKDCQRSRG
jgi:hypothetical protein